ncbi:MAG TPA: hypothetical protein VEB42_11105, partial [Chitinophagaceae bacterium]|nr:hypothetical protein [Chitinophagaceae bacterium]
TYFHPDLSATPFAKVIGAPTAADIAFAKNNFYQPVAYDDSAGNLTKVFYDPHRLIVARTIDAVDNEMKIEAINYRSLSACKLKDANDNISGIRVDELGMATHTFIMGKEGEFQGDLMDNTTLEASPIDRPGSVLEYQFRYFSTNGSLPDSTKSSVREKHHFKGTLDVNGQPEIENNFRWQESYVYSDGSGHEVLRKVQAEPGPAPQRNAAGALVTDLNGNLLPANTNTRWVGTGRVIYNNKGNAVKEYEPYFDSTHEYNTELQLVQLGFTSVTYYDALDRVIKTVRPNGTFSKTEFNAWMEKIWDANDTVLDNDCTWFKARIDGGKGPVEQLAAQTTIIHNNTPAIRHFDSLGRAFLDIAQNKTQRSGEAVLESLRVARTYLDVEGNALRITHERNGQEIEIMRWQYDMLGNICSQQSADAGKRWVLQHSN